MSEALSQPNHEEEPPAEGYYLSCQEFVALLEKEVRRPRKADGYRLWSEMDDFVGLNMSAEYFFWKFRKTCPEPTCTKSISCTLRFKDDSHPVRALYAIANNRQFNARRERFGRVALRGEVTSTAEIDDDVPDGQGGSWMSSPVSAQDKAVLNELTHAIERFDYTQVGKSPDIVRRALLHAASMSGISHTPQDAAVGTFLEEAYADDFQRQPRDSDARWATKRKRKERMVATVARTMTTIRTDLGYPAF